MIRELEMFEKPWNRQLDELFDMSNRTTLILSLGLMLGSWNMLGQATDQDDSSAGSEGSSQGLAIVDETISGASESVSLPVQIAQDLQRELIQQVAAESSGTGRTSSIGEGEILQLHVIEDQTFDQLYQVRPGGYIILPRVGRVPVAGKNLEQAEEEVRIALEKAQQLIDATVLIERPTTGYSDESSIIFLAGAFEKQGPKRAAAGVTQSLISVLLGETTKDLADFSQVRVLRREDGKAVVINVDVQAILDGRQPRSEDVLIIPGDIIVLPLSPTVYVSGNVATPGMLKIEDDEPLTAYTAILKSGGFARFANKKKVYVVRSLGEGKTEKIPVDIRAVQKGKEPDIVLQGRDVVVVPEKWFSW